MALDSSTYANPDGRPYHFHGAQFSLSLNLVKVQDAFAVALPYLTKAFHYGFIPFVLLLGMRSGSAAERPRLTDLLTPF